jgi:hypothetical protein
MYTHIYINDIILHALFASDTSTHKALITNVIRLLEIASFFFDNIEMTKLVELR